MNISIGTNGKRLPRTWITRSTGASETLILCTIRIQLYPQGRRIVLIQLKVHWDLCIGIIDYTLHIWISTYRYTNSLLRLFCAVHILISDYWWLETGMHKLLHFHRCNILMCIDAKESRHSYALVLILLLLLYRSNASNILCNALLFIKVVRLLLGTGIRWRLKMNHRLFPTKRIEGVVITRAITYKIV